MEQKKAEIIENLKKFRDEAGPWEKLGTTIHGVNIANAPGRGQNKGTLMLEINPTNKRRGLFLRTPEEVEAFRDAINNQQVIGLTEAIVEANNQTTEQNPSRPKLQV